MGNKTKSKVDKAVVRAMKKLLNNDKLMNEMALNTKAFMKLNVKEQKSLLRFHKRIKDNTRWITLRDTFIDIYAKLRKENLTKDKVWVIINQLEKQIRKKYGYWKVKKEKRVK